MIGTSVMKELSDYVVLSSVTHFVISILYYDDAIAAEYWKYPPISSQYSHFIPPENHCFFWCIQGV